MKPLQPHEKAHLGHIAWWYYKRNMTQAQIAERLGFTRQRVNQLIGMLTDLGVVEIKINGMEDNCAPLEAALENAFHLDRAFVFDISEHGYANVLEQFGEKAAEAVGFLLKDGQNIGVSWGRTLEAVVSRFPARNLSRCTVNQMVGGLNTQNKQTTSDEITRQLAEKLGCGYRLLYAPATLESSEAKEILLQDGAFAAMFKQLEKCDVALLGVGELTKGSTLHTQQYLSETILRQMLSDGCVGDLAMQPFTKEGQWKSYLPTMGISPGALGQIPCVVAVACGMQKADAVWGALHTGCLNVLVIDKAIAQSIIEKVHTSELE